MTSQLAKQLERLQLRPAGGVVTSTVHSGASFLFSKADAKSYSREQILELCADGLRTLLQIDNRMHPFVPILFHPEKTRQERGLLITEENRVLSQHIEAFLVFLSPHLFLTAAHQVLEYLIRVHEVHVYNTSALIRAFLPYHNHNLFSRMLLLIDLRDTGFDFLVSNQERGAPLMREDLLLACSHSRKVLQLVCECALLPMRLGVYHGAANALFVAVAVRLAVPSAASPRPEIHWRQLLPYVLEMLSSWAPGIDFTAANGFTEEGVNDEEEGTPMKETNARRRRTAGAALGLHEREAVCTALLVIGSWSAEVQFSVPMLVALTKPLMAFILEQSGSAAEREVSKELDQVEDATGVARLSLVMPLNRWLSYLDLLLQTQKAFHTDSASFASLWRSLLQVPWESFAAQHPFFRQFAQREDQRAFSADRQEAPRGPLSSLMSLLVSFCLDRIKVCCSFASLSSDVEAFFLTAVGALPLPFPLVEEALQCLMKSQSRFVDLEAGGEGSRRSKTDSDFFEQAFRSLERRYPRVFDRFLSAALHQKALQEAARLLIAQHLSGSRFQIVSLPQLNDALPLFSCLLHPSKEVRMLGVETLKKLPLEQWVASTGATTGAVEDETAALSQAGDHSLLGLASHVLSYEPDPVVASALLRALTPVFLELLGLVKKCAAGEASTQRLFSGCSIARVQGLLLAVLPAACQGALLHASMDHDDGPVPVLWRELLQVLLLKHTATKPSSLNGWPSKFSSRVLYQTVLLHAALSSKHSTSLREEIQTALTNQFSDLASPRGAPSPAAPAAASLLLLRSPTLLLQLSPTAVKRLPELLRLCRQQLEKKSEKNEAASLLYTECVLAAAAGVCGELSTAFTSGQGGECVVGLLRFLLGKPLADALCERAFTGGARTVDASFLVEEREEAGKEQRAEGYLAKLQENERQALRGDAAAVKEGSKKCSIIQIGRGASQTILTCAYLPSDGLTKGLAELLSHTVPLILPTLYSLTAGLGGAALVKGMGVLQLSVLLLPLLSAPLPSLSVSPQLLVYTYFRLLPCPDESVDPAMEFLKKGFNLTLYEAVHEAVFGEGSAGARPLTLDRGTLGLLLSLPLCAPNETVREKHCQLLQDCILRASGKPKAGDAAAVHFLSSGMHGENPCCSVTILSAIVESMVRESSRFLLPDSAARLVAECAAAVWGSAAAGASCSATSALSLFIMPRGLAGYVLEFFFPVGDEDAEKLSRKAKDKPSPPAFPLDILFPSVAALLQSHGTTAPSGVLLSAEGVRYVEAVCARSHVTPFLDTLGKGKTGSGASKSAVPPSLQLISLLLEKPIVHTALSSVGTSSSPSSGAGGVAHPLYRHALRMLAVSLQHGEGLVRSDFSGLAEHRQHAAHEAVIFRANKKEERKADRSSAVFALSEAEVEVITRCTRPALLQALLRLGSGSADVARLCVQTVGGFHRVFIPVLSEASERFANEEKPSMKTKAKKTKPSEAEGSMDQTQLLESLVEMLDLLQPSLAAQDTASTHFIPPASCYLANPLTLEWCGKLLDLCRDTIVSRTTASAEHSDETVRRLGLLLLSRLLRIAPTIASLVDGIAQADSDEDHPKPASQTAPQNLLQFLHHFLDCFPLPSLLPLILRAEDDGAQLNDAVKFGESVNEVGFTAFTRSILALVDDLVRIAVECREALQRQANGAQHFRTRLLKEGITVMGSAVVPAEEESGSEIPLTPRRIALIAAWLRTLSPLLAVLHEDMQQPLEEEEEAAASEGFALHIPIVSLLIRLEPSSYSQTLGYRSAVEVCRNILTSFDVVTQMRCLTKLMKLVVSPEAVLAPLDEVSSAPVAKKTKQQQSASPRHNDSEERAELSKLFRKMVKPNQILNRQELLLHFINAVIKSDRFLPLFIQLQYQNRSAAHHSHQKGSEHAVEEAVESSGGAVKCCTALLTQTLSLFSHYSDWNATTPGSAERRLGGAEEMQSEADEAAETKAYVMMLELLAGNTLACVLASINEPTFVQCLETLLIDARPAVQQKGLEVLLDRLHHSLPTAAEENEGDDGVEPLQSYEKAVRDPSQRKLRLIDVVRVKARPLATKRSFSLQPHLSAMLNTCIALLSGNNVKGGSEVVAERVLHRFTLSVSCMEELVRIVGSGGSLQAEKTLLNVHRSKVVAEATLVKLFGNKKRVEEVRQFLLWLCNECLPALHQHLKKVLDAAGGDVNANVETILALQHGMSACFSFIGTCVQVMGASFILPDAVVVLECLISSITFQVSARVVAGCGVQAEGETAQDTNSLYRYTALTALLRAFPSSWHMSQPYLPPLLLAVAHRVNADDPRTRPLCEEVMAVLEAVLDPAVLLQSIYVAVSGWESAELRPFAAAVSSARRLRLSTVGHDVPLVFQSVQRLLERVNRDEVSQMSFLCEGTSPASNLWISSLDLLSRSSVLPTSEVLSAVIKAFEVFFIKFKAKHCNLFLTRLGLWAFGEKSDEAKKEGIRSPAAGKKKRRTEEKPKEEDEEEEEEAEGSSGTGTHSSLTRTAFHRWTLFYTLYNALLDKLGSIFEFSFGVVTPYIVEHLQRFGGGVEDRGSGNFNVSSTMSSRRARFLEEVILALRGMSAACTPAADYDYSVPPDVYVAHVEVFNAVMPLLIRQIANVQGLSDSIYTWGHRVEHHVIPAVRAFFAALGGANANKLQAKTQAEIARHLRNPNPLVRRLALQAIDGVYADGGEELAARLMGEVLPSIVELTEDRDGLVVEQARTVCDHLSTITGQDVLHAMSA